MNSHQQNHKPSPGSTHQHPPQPTSRSPKGTSMLPSGSQLTTGCWGTAGREQCGLEKGPGMRKNRKEEQGDGCSPKVMDGVRVHPAAISQTRPETS